METWVPLEAQNSPIDTTLLSSTATRTTKETQADSAAMEETSTITRNMQDMQLSMLKSK